MNQLNRVIQNFILSNVAVRLFIERNAFEISRDMKVKIYVIHETQFFYLSSLSIHKKINT